MHMQAPSWLSHNDDRNQQTYMLLIRSLYPIMYVVAYLSVRIKCFN